MPEWDKIRRREKERSDGSNEPCQMLLGSEPNRNEREHETNSAKTLEYCLGSNVQIIELKKNKTKFIENYLRRGGKLSKKKLESIWKSCENFSQQRRP